MRKQAERLLRASMMRARDLSARLLNAEEDERKRIAHDLHDQIGQELTALKIRLETAARVTDSPAWRAQALEAGMDDFLTKPIDASRLVAVAERFTRRGNAATL